MTPSAGVLMRKNFKQIILVYHFMSVIPSSWLSKRRMALFDKVRSLAIIILNNFIWTVMITFLFTTC